MCKFFLRAGQIQTSRKFWAGRICNRNCLYAKTLKHWLVAFLLKKKARIIFFGNHYFRNELLLIIHSNVIFKSLFALEIEFFKDQIDKFCIHFVPRNPSVDHKTLGRGPYLVLWPQVAHLCTITFSFAILLASVICDDLKFVMSGQRPGTIFNNRVGHCTTQLILFSHRLEIKWETFFYIETT